MADFADIRVCTCRPDFVWFPEIENCRVNCSTDSYANLTDFTASIPIRKCICLPLSSLIREAYDARSTARKSFLRQEYISLTILVAAVSL
jgi:hypothetical protein